MKKPNPLAYLLVFILITILLFPVFIYLLTSIISGFLPDEMAVSIIWMVVLFLDIFIGVILLFVYLYKSKSIEIKEMTTKEKEKFADEVKKNISLDKK